MNLGSVGYLSLPGLGTLGAAGVSRDQVFGLLRPLIPQSKNFGVNTFSNEELYGIIDRVLGKYAVAKGGETAPGAEGDIRSAIIAVKGAGAALWKDELTAAFTQLGNQGYKIVSKSGSTASSSSETADVQNPSAIDVFKAVIENVKKQMPDLLAAKKGEAVVTRPRPKPVSPWLIAGVGIAVLGTAYLVLRK